MRDRPLRYVPRPVLMFLVLSLVLQIAFNVRPTTLSARLDKLAAPPDIATLRLLSLGEPIALAKALMLYTQSFDNQTGAQIPLARLDYPILESWLDHIQALDPASQYPLLMASRIYAEVAEPDRQRSMLEFIYTHFFEDPNHRWPWLAHAAIIAKHRLHDLPLARKYAQAIRLSANDPGIPHWASQMEIFILEDMEEQQSAQILLGALLETGQITDPEELRFLNNRLKMHSFDSSPN
ncbi:hypothetical protein ACMYR3_10970 [Ampullimonas aquatilis]|uniref:hypothetical protein n=1 Tax=Ampullimonas aquatilis TaxID=1341549 RepID=UPI003C789D79